MTTDAQVMHIIYPRMFSAPIVCLGNVLGAFEDTVRPEQLSYVKSSFLPVRAECVPHRQKTLVHILRTRISYFVI